MTPDDSRHGTYAGAVAHWFDNERPCNNCAKAEWRYRKQRKLDHLRGKPRLVPAQGPLRRIQALQALGWTGQQIATEAGLSLATLRSIQYHKSTTIRRPTAEAIADAYERMSMRRPEGRYAHRSRLVAARKGWPPPLAWDCIDTDTHPRGIRTDEPTNPTADRRAALQEMVERGDGLTQATRQLGITINTLHIWCRRNNMPDTYRQLANREGDWNSPGRLSREGAA